jgi:16S rRNA (guanine966-N2)-methyltransferase
MTRGFVRIIGGNWRGRKLKVLDLPDLRPTPDRVRETLFNWLAPVIHGAYCLDLFAGSGALGFEALSRGASYVVMIDRSPVIVKHLREQLLTFKVDNAEIYQAEAPKIKPPEKLFDIVFLDPPYQQNLLLPSCFYLVDNKLLAKGAYVYLETKEEINENDLPEGWQLLKSKKAGQVAYHLVRTV